jgi:hypothetical protein
MARGNDTIPHFGAGGNEEIPFLPKIEACLV